jgi:hypothetical protein
MAHELEPGKFQRCWRLSLEPRATACSHGLELEPRADLELEPRADLELEPRADLELEPRARTARTWSPE